MHPSWLRYASGSEGPATALGCIHLHGPARQ
jgi:hypothetical protein